MARSERKKKVVKITRFLYLVVSVWSWMNMEVLIKYLYFTCGV
jgi:hypothetical protein